MRSDWLWGTQSPVSSGCLRWGLFPREYSDRGLKLTTHLHVILKLKMHSRVLRLCSNAQWSIGTFMYYRFLGPFVALERNQLTSSQSQNPKAVNSVIGLDVTAHLSINKNIHFNPEVQREFSNIANPVISSLMNRKCSLPSFVQQFYFVRWSHIHYMFRLHRAIIRFTSLSKLVTMHTVVNIFDLSVNSLSAAGC
jgi:hypothetical protein